MTRLPFVLALLLPLAACLGGGGAQRLLVISGSDSEITFATPDTKGLVATHWRIEPSDAAYTSCVALWRPPRGMFPQAKIEYMRLCPGYKFNREHPVARYVRRLKFGGARPTLTDEARTLRNAQGYVQYHRFSLTAVPCVGFVQDWRRNANIEGPRRMSGYYCERDGGQLSGERVLRIAKAARVRDLDDGTETALPDGDGERRIVGLWQNYAENLAGIAVLAPDGRPTRAWFSLPDARGECRGDTEFLPGPQARPRMRLFCTNGRQARFEISGSEADGWQARGQDARGNLITLDVEP